MGGLVPPLCTDRNWDVGITVASPSLDMAGMAFGRQLLATKMPCEEVTWAQPTRMVAVDLVRNQLVQKFLEQEKPAERLLFIDDDMIWHPLSVERLWERDLDIVAGLTWTNECPPIPTLWQEEHQKDGRYYYIPQLEETLSWLQNHEHQFTSNDPVVLPQTEDDLVEVAVTGAAFMLIKRSVLEALEPPWFEGHTEYHFGEDFDFCRKARAAGFKIYVDRSVIVTHAPNRYPLGPVTFRAFMSITRGMSEEEKKAWRREA